jgi:hypothetical protein
VHTLAFGLSLTGAGPGRIAEAFGGVAETQGPERGSSPTSGTVFSLVRGIVALTCVQSLRWGASNATSAGFSLAAAEPMQCVGWRVQVRGWWSFRVLTLSFLRFLFPVLLGGPALAYIYSCRGGVGTT